MKDIRKGNDITVKWTVTAGSPIDLEKVELNLFDQYGDKAIINDVEVTVTGENVYLYQFKFYGKDQKRTGIYRVLLQRNVDEIGMVTLDKTSAFHLFGVCDFGIVRGEDEDHVETVVVELESTISTSVEGEGFDPELYYTKDETNALLAERQRAFTSQDPLEMRNNILRLKMLAIGIDVKGFVGTQVFPEVSTEKDAIMPSIKAIEDHIVAPLQTSINGKQDIIQDLSGIRSGASAGATAYQKPASGIPATDLAQAVQTSLGKADTALQDAPSDGQQYARKDHEWVPVSASGGGGGSLTIVEVTDGTTAIAAEADKYYVIDGDVGNLAITLPTISSSETATKKCIFAFTAGSNPLVVFGTEQSGASIAYYDGYSIIPTKKYVVSAEWNGVEWSIKEMVEGSGNASFDTSVTITLLEIPLGTVGTATVPAQPVILRIPILNKTYTNYTDNYGNAVFSIPFGYTYNITLPQREGWYIHEGKYTKTYIADSPNQVYAYTYTSYESGLFVVASDGGTYTFDEWKEAVTAGTRQNSEAVVIKVFTDVLASHGGVFGVSIDMLRNRNYGNNLQWLSSNTLLNSIPSNGNSVTAEYYYDGYSASSAIIEEARNRNLSCALFTTSESRSITLVPDPNDSSKDIVLHGFVGSIGQWTELWRNVSEIDEILVYTRPSGTYLLSTLTVYKPTSAQASATNNYIFITSPVSQNNSKIVAYIPLNFYSF